MALSNFMKHRTVRIVAAVFLLHTAMMGAVSQARAQGDKVMYPAMAPLNEYLMSNRESEIALARSAAPKSVSDGAEVLVMGREGYVTAVKGTNGFVCLVQRSWAATTDSPEFWNPKVMAPTCVNPPAARSFLPGLLMKARLALAGKSRTEIAQAITSALDSKELPALESGAMSYMTSKHQYLSDRDKSWHPHLMWFVPGDAAASWGANLPGSPVLAANDAEDRLTIFLVWVARWSDGTPGPQEAHRPPAHAM